MLGFQCTLDLSGLPQSVRRGERIQASVLVRQANQPVSAAVIAADTYGISQRLKRLDTQTFFLDLTVPFIAPAGQFRYSVWAVSEAGERSQKQSGAVTIR